MDDSSVQNEGGGGGALSNILTDEKRQRSDMVLLRRAARGRWGVSPSAMRTAQARLMEIIRKDTVTVPGMAGPVESEGTADLNAIAAVRTLAVLNAQDQADDHHADKLVNDDRRIDLEAFSVASAAYQALPDAEKVAMAVRMGKVDLLPPRLRAMIPHD